MADASRSGHRLNFRRNKSRKRKHIGCECSAKGCQQEDPSRGFIEKRSSKQEVQEHQETQLEDSGPGPSTAQSSGYVLPGFHYLGPCNPVDNGQPTNKIDEAARRHDIRYEEAEATFKATGNYEQAFKSIQNADEEFLEELDNITPSTLTEACGKLAGQIGIGVKKRVEGFLHSTLHPRFDES